jgi:tripartite-type tricarboxylate transporter receptor subunit TctC
LRKVLGVIVAALALIAAAGHAAWPQSRTIRVILPVPPGGEGMLFRIMLYA